MAIVVIVKNLRGLKCVGKKAGGDRLIKIDFRGVSHYSNSLLVEADTYDGDSPIAVNQSFTWNFGRDVEESETLQLSIVTRNVLRSEKVIGQYGLVLQSVVRDGRVSITDALVDLNNKPIAITISFEIRYEPAPHDDGSSENWSLSCAPASVAALGVATPTTAEMLEDDERQMLIDIEENIANLERSLANRAARMATAATTAKPSARTTSASGVNNGGDDNNKPAAAYSSRFKNLVHQYQKSRVNRASHSMDVPTSDRKNSTLKTMRSFIRLGKQRPSSREKIKSKSMDGNSDGGDGCDSSDCSETHQLLDSSCEHGTNFSTNNNASTRASNTSLETANFSSSEKLDDNDSCGSGAHLLGGDDDAWETPENIKAAPATTELDNKNNQRHRSKKLQSGRQTVGIRLKQPVDPAASADFQLRAQHYQVCITIIEARQLAGLNMDPVVCVQVGDQRKYTSVKESTNCPYYNEVQQSRNLLRANLTLGSFKLDIATVWAQQDHQFYHKWALLTDADDVAGGPKGYLKCDISVIGKGDSVKVPAVQASVRKKIDDRDDDDIEGNLLLPRGNDSNAPVIVERQLARFIVKIYRADGLPKMNSSVMANVKKAFTGGQLKDLVDPYVRVSFAGLSGKTSVKRNSYAPVWNEQVIFTEMFPPLCQRIKIQLRDDDPVNESVIGTHFIDLKEISNDGERGFLPTFGPAFIHLYGSTRDYRIVDRHSTLNSGLGEGISYRARLLIAIKTEMINDNVPVDIGSGGPIVSSNTSYASVTQTIPANETAYATNEEFFLFATIMDATMIDKKLGERPMYFEISIGNAGNTLDGHNESSKVGSTSKQITESSSSSTDLQPTVAPINEYWQSTTFPAKPMTHDRLYHYMPYWDDKPCLHVRSVWPDYRRRMYNSNIIGKIVEKLEEGLGTVQFHEDEPLMRGEKFLKSVLDELCIGCNRYISLSKSSATGGGGSGGLMKTELDKERIKLCQRELENIALIAKNLKARTTKNTFKECLNTARTFLEKLKFLLQDPQQSLPDVFVWVISSGKRVAYHRIPARDIVYSIVDEESGRNCAIVQNIFLKLPGKKGFTATTGGSTLQAKLQIYMWLGVSKHKKYLIQGLPKGYEMNNELKNFLEKPRLLVPPLSIHYIEKHKFQLRAHMYQARSLIGSDSSGLSDPFARVICGEYHKTTQVIDETLSPTWDELLIIDDIIIYSTGFFIKKDPPTVVIQLFDRDKVGKSEYIGQTIGRTRVKLASDAYVPPEFPPSLEWYKITRGSEPAGELLAVFELLEHESSRVGTATIVPKLPDQPKYYLNQDGTGIPDQGPIFPVPHGIRPTLSKYRIEVLFWGLRDLRRIHLLSVDQPRVDVECAGHVLHSSVITNAKKNPNFSTPIKFMDLELPDQELYRPPVTIRTIDCRSFGRYTLVGTHTINSIQRYMLQQKDNENVSLSSHHHHYRTIPTTTLLSLGKGTRLSSQVLTSSSDFGIIDDVSIKGNNKCNNNNLKKKKKKKSLKKRDKLRSNRSCSGGHSTSGSLSSDFTNDDNDSSRDWWTKYFASIEATMADEINNCFDDEIPTPSSASSSSSSLGEMVMVGADGLESGWRSSKIVTKKFINDKKSYSSTVNSINGGTVERQRKNAMIKIYRNELEAQKEFNHFREWLDTFELYRGKKSANDDQDDDCRIVGSFKGALRVYKQQSTNDNDETTSDAPTLSRFDNPVGFFQSLPIPSNEPIHVLVRVYIVKANDLHPCDPNGKADPYVVLQLGDKRISDKDNYISKQLNPVFGKCFEIEATFPQDSLLTVQLLDWDLVGADDAIGETRIDLENRFYSKHRATCGLARQYDEFGYNKWRDPMKPTQILSKLCKDGKLEPPSYSHGRVSIGKKFFTLSNEEMQNHMDPTKRSNIDEHLALAVLNRWSNILVPEHVESRPLYKPEKPGIEQGRLDMWVDMFPMDMPLPGPPVDISPRKPKGYELRVIIFNTEDVVLEDDAFFTGEKMSDIYVKGWLRGPEDCQSTDIHYRSLTGEGNFNWRFIYPFDYLVAEERIVINRKESLFSWDETEFKIPARLELQVWDADHFSADDFLGAITLDLNRFPRGAKNSKLCTLSMLKTDGTVPVINIFKQKRVKGWWPFYVKKQNEDMELTGKVEAEIHLLTREEAESNPAGYGRSEPDPLDKPSRPDASFVWLLNPLKSIKYIIWHNYKWLVLRIVVIFAVALLLILFFYAIPGYLVKKILGA